MASMSHLSRSNVLENILVNDNITILFLSLRAREKKNFGNTRLLFGARLKCVGRLSDVKKHCFKMSYSPPLRNL